MVLPARKVSYLVHPHFAPRLSLREGKQLGPESQSQGVAELGSLSLTLEPLCNTAPSPSSFYCVSLSFSTLVHILGHLKKGTTNTPAGILTPLSGPSQNTSSFTLWLSIQVQLPDASFEEGHASVTSVLSTQ